MKKIFTGAVIAFVLCTAICFLADGEPGQCALCGSGAYDAPCLVDLSAGTVTELDNPTTDSRNVFCVKGGVGLAVDRLPEGRRCTACLPERSAAMDRRLYCRGCRGLLAGLRGYALADLSDPASVRVYPLAACTIRDYTIAVSGNTVKVLF